MKHWLPALVTLVSAITVILLSALTLSQHTDEAQYVWSAAYYGGRLARWDFSPAGPNLYTNPGWEPFDYWPLTQPFGTRAVYAAVLRLSGLPAPTAPYSYSDPGLEGPDTAVPAETLPVVRLAAVACAAVGLALIALRFGWAGTGAGFLFLLLPFVASDLARAWAEGPLLLGMGIVAVAFGTPWLGAALGLAAAFKLTGLALWPLLLVRPGGYRRLPFGLLSAFAVWTILTPQSWFGGGPIYLVPMLVYREFIYSGQSVTYPGFMGHFLPTRYLWPMELAMCLLITSYVTRRRVALVSLLRSRGVLPIRHPRFN